MSLCHERAKVLLRSDYRNSVTWREEKLESTSICIQFRRWTNDHLYFFWPSPQDAYDGFFSINNHANRRFEYRVSSDWNYWKNRRQLKLRFPVGTGVKITVWLKFHLQPVSTLSKRARSSGVWLTPRLAIRRI